MTDRPPSASPGDEDIPAGSADPGESRGFLTGLLYGIREIVIIVVMAMVLSLIVKTWIAQAFFIPSGSMEETLQVGDRVIVSKLNKQFDGINRGDIVVFKDPGSWLPPSTHLQEDGLRGDIQRGLTFIGLLPDPADEHLIKRVIGVAGDHVVCCDDENRLTINGAPITETYVYAGDAASTLQFDITVPADAVWVMGDHRSDSQDSRFHPIDGDGSDGSVPLDLIVGRAVVTVWPFTHLGGLSNYSHVFSSVPAP